MVARLITLFRSGTTRRMSFAVSGTSGIRRNGFPAGSRFFAPATNDWPGEFGRPSFSTGSFSKSGAACKK